ncbi:hypothetical protein MUGA111182_15860 [Mucilaginibacter galii]|uniref:hypothetical protein n=1 Tax=Mucilaginibacter galii TaxID=2005073 RepID=UPI00166557D2|nr:hypothetical protein [Mucilaginibacter galii]
MLKGLQRRRFLWPVLIFALELAAYAQNKGDDKNYVSGKLQSDLNKETSGIAASTDHPNIFYIHNDSGDTSRFFAITPDGKLKGIFNYAATGGGTHGVKDCEDIAVGEGPEAGKSYVYMGDIGDNASNNPHITVYRIAEPQIPTDASNAQNLKSAPLYLKYPDAPRDAETLMIDPVEKLLYIVTKRGSDVGVYTAPLKFNAGHTVTLTKRCELHFRGLQPFKWIVSGDISKDGSQVILKSYSRIYYWKREGNEPIWQTLQRKPRQPAYEQERLGEAVGFAPNGKSYYTVSEGAKQPIFHYAVPKP